MLAAFGQEKPLVLAGHSHINCFGIPNSKDGGSELIELRKAPLVFGLRAPMPRPDDFVSTMSRLLAGKQVAILYSGWDQLLFPPDPLFDFVSSEFPSLPTDPTARILPEAFVLAHDSIRHFPFFLRADFERLRQGGLNDLVILCPPPPKGDNEEIRARMNFETILVDRAKSMGLDLTSAPITPPFIRLKMWRLVRRIYEQEAASTGALFVGVPPLSQDRYGFLKEEFWAPDVTHANAAYGELYLEYLLNALHLTTSPVVRR
jgi:hypothetical protein